MSGERRKQPERSRRSPCRSRSAPSPSLSRLRSIDGRHPLAHVAPSAVVQYPARRRHDGRIAYFNFDLAREIGLIPADHPDRLAPDLHDALLETFGLVIVNEWDVAHDRSPPERDRLPHPYMATRYLQIQHPDKQGRSSGDGRSIWNGRLRGPRGEWDVSSCGTGVTRLCPATSATGRFFRTGNALADYGSVRQFGLYHHRYRFQDTDRLSTSIPEQRRKARQIVQRFAQIRELLLTGVAPPLRSLRDDATLQLFDETFASWRRRLFLQQIGFDPRTTRRLAARETEAVDRLLALHHRLERRRSSRGPHRVPDGLSWNAVYCMRDVLRCLPEALLAPADDRDPRISPEQFYAIALSDYASRRDRTLTPYRRRLARDYQARYLALVDLAGGRGRRTRGRVLEALRPVARARNPEARMTGDGLTHATHRIASSRHHLAAEEAHWLIQAFADSQQREPVGSPRDPSAMRPLVQRIHRDVLALIRDHRESL